ncbi:hypothetical protein [Natronorarus salvus]|uniref:hypothetical protein n=1 Tax=Natronorarus salvus TaxID=3117733 RepID=UPI002F269AD5
MRSTRSDRTGPERRIDRRDVLRALGAVGVTAIAGCAGEETDPTDDGGDDDPPDDDAGDDDPDTDDGDGEEVADDADDGEVEEGDDEESEADDEDDETTRFGDTIQFADSYAYEATVTEEGTGQEFRMEGRIARGDSYMRMDGEEGVMEIYAIDGETFFVENEAQCFALPEAEREGEEPEDVDAGTHEEEVDEHPELESVGKDEIDGEDVYVFELTAEEAAAHDEEVTYYVGVESGYLRRVETDEAVIDFHSWGEVDSIDPPDMECMAIDGEFDDDDLPNVRI